MSSRIRVHKYLARCQAEHDITSKFKHFLNSEKKQVSSHFKSLSAVASSRSHYLTQKHYCPIAIAAFTPQSALHGVFLYKIIRKHLQSFEICHVSKSENTSATY